LKILKTYEDFSHRDLVKSTVKQSIEYSKVMTDMSKDDTIQYVAEHCKEFINRPVLIYRECNAKVDFFRSEPIQRTSRDNPNWYTLMIDNSNNWKEYPKRGKSFICSIGDEHEVLGPFYYVVIPIDGSNWGIAPEDDIYECFWETLGTGPDNFFEQLNRLSLKLDLDGISDDSYTGMLSDINKLSQELFTQKYIKLSVEDVNLYQVHNFFTTNGSEALPYKIDYAMKPDLNKFTHKKYTEIKYDENQFDNYKELWTDSPCVFIKYGNRGENFKNFINNLSKYINKNISFESL